MNKRAALELSITAIVVLIIAVTVLGLGIGFIKKQFGAGTELFTQEYTKIREQMRDQIRTGAQLLVFNIPEEVSIGKGGNVIVGVKNTAAYDKDICGGTDDRVCFRVEVMCNRPFSSDRQFCYPDAQGPVSVGGFSMSGDEATGGPVESGRNWFRTLLGEFDLKNYEGDVFDAQMLVRGVPPDTYRMETKVWKSSSNCNCIETGDDPSEWELYASKTFQLRVV